MSRMVLQATNVHAIMESDPRVSNVRNSLNDALALLDDVNENLATFDTKLHVMREDIAAIEVRTGIRFPALECSVSKGNASLEGTLNH